MTLSLAGRGCYPGSFNPPTVAHLAICDAVMNAGLDGVDLVLSRIALGKEHIARPIWQHRVAVVERVAAMITGVECVVTDRQLLVDIAQGYDALVLGADKWNQVLDPAFYGGSKSARDEALAALPRLAVVTRFGSDLPRLPPDAMVIELDDEVRSISSTGARDGNRAWMASAAAAFDVESGAWGDPDRYDRWLERCAGDELA